MVLGELSVPLGKLASQPVQHRLAAGELDVVALRDVAQLRGADGQALWSHQAWVDDDAYDPAGQKEMLRRLVADMAHDHVIPAAVRVPDRSFVVVTEAADPAIDVRSYAVRFSRCSACQDWPTMAPAGESSG